MLHQGHFSVFLCNIILRHDNINSFGLKWEKAQQKIWIHFAILSADGHNRHSHDFVNKRVIHILHPSPFGNCYYVVSQKKIV